MASYLYPILPKTGLANMLFVWARAEVAAAETGMLVLSPSWTKINRVITSYSIHYTKLYEVHILLKRYMLQQVD